MCSPAIIEKVKKRITRRNLLQGIGVSGAASASGCLAQSVSSSKPPDSSSTNLPESVSFTRVVDLSHTLHPNFPAWFVAGQQVTTRGKRTFVPPEIVEVKSVFEWNPDKVNLKQITYWEHVGTHMDAPSHFSEGSTVDEIPAEDLVLPLAVVDIKAHAHSDPLARLTMKDIQKWESKHGPIPERAMLALNSGWAKYVDTPKYKSLDENGKHRQPGFHPEVAQFLMEERNVVALGVDTFSFDNQLSKNSEVHYLWMGDNRWGIENLNNLDDVPAVGATVVVGQPSIQGGSGGPSRVMALV